MEGLILVVGLPILAVSVLVWAGRKLLGVIGCLCRMWSLGQEASCTSPHVDRCSVEGVERWNLN